MYDFTTLPKRRNTGSAKWQLIEQDNKEGIPMSVADMEFVMMPELREGLKNALDHMVFGYPGGNDGYYAAVSKWMKKRHDIEVTKDMVVSTPGVISAIQTGIETFTNRGDGVIIMPPVYPPFAQSIKYLQREILSCPLKAENGYSIDFEKLEALASQVHARILLFCSPHNPVGRVWTKEELQRLEEICEENELFIISDEIWADIHFPNHPHTTYLKLRKKLLMVCFSPSKTFNTAGLFTSQIILPDYRDLREFRKMLLKKHLGVNALGYEATRICYTEGEAWRKEMIRTIRENFHILQDFLTEKAPKAVLTKCEGTYVAWVDFRSYDLSSEDLEKRCADCAFYPSYGAAFGEEGEGFLRLNLALPAAALQKELKKIPALLNDK